MTEFETEFERIKAKHAQSLETLAAEGGFNALAARILLDSKEHDMEARLLAFLFHVASVSGGIIGTTFDNPQNALNAFGSEMCAAAFEAHAKREEAGVADLAASVIAKAASKR